MEKSKLKGVNNLSQMSLFDGTKPLKIDKPIRLVELFSGYGSQFMALKKLGVQCESWKTCEWEVNAIKASKALHFENDNTDYSKEFSNENLIEILFDLGISNDGKEPMAKASISRKNGKWLRETYNNIKATHNLVNIMKVKGKHLNFDNENYFNMVSYSYPCFTADSLVLTECGYKHIIDIKIGDKVLTYDNSYQKVTNIFNQGIKPLLKINAMGIDEIKCTPNHKFLTREKYNFGHKCIRAFKDPCWKECKDLTKKDYLGVAINQNSVIPRWDGIIFEWSDGRKSRYKNELQPLMNNPMFWWIIGRYIGDGWIRTQGGIIICCDKDETKDILDKVEGLFNYYISQQKNINKIHIPLKELEMFVEQFGKGAGHKHLTNTIIDLPSDKLKAFLDGYISADGCFSQGVYKATSISRELIYGIAQCVAKVYKTPYRIYKTIRKPTCIIEGRTVNQNDTYQVVFKTQRNKQDKAFYENGNIWYPIKKIINIESDCVYDIEVANNHSFTVQNTIVHNCQDLSKAGNQKGMDKGSGTRSGLLWEVERILTEIIELKNSLPNCLLMENVPDVHGTKNIHNFAKWIDFLESIGYKNYWQDLNAKNYGIPQNRDRTFMVSVLGDYYYEFPQPIKLELKLKDMLEENVDEKYYISNAKIESIQNSSFMQNQRIIQEKDICDTLCARDYKDQKCVIIPKLEQIGSLINSPYDKMHESSRRIYSTNGIAPTINTVGGGNLEPKILDDIYNNREPRICDDCPTLRADRQGLKVVEPIINCLNAKDENGIQPSLCDRVYDINGVSPAITTAPFFQGNILEENDSGVVENYRVRKLTPTECLALMGVSQVDIQKLAKCGLSNSALYKLAGNSIVIQILTEIFRIMF